MRITKDVSTAIVLSGITILSCYAQVYADEILEQSAITNFLEFVKNAYSDSEVLEGKGDDLIDLFYMLNDDQISLPEFRSGLENIGGSVTEPVFSNTDADTEIYVLDLVLIFQHRQLGISLAQAGAKSSIFSALVALSSNDVELLRVLILGSGATSWSGSDLLNALETNADFSTSECINLWLGMALEYPLDSSPIRLSQYEKCIIRTESNIFEKERLIRNLAAASGSFRSAVVDLAEGDSKEYLLSRFGEAVDNYELADYRFSKYVSEQDFENAIAILKKYDLGNAPIKPENCIACRNDLFETMLLSQMIKDLTLLNMPSDWSWDDYYNASTIELQVGISTETHHESSWCNGAGTPTLEMEEGLVIQKNSKIVLECQPHQLRFFCNIPPGIVVDSYFDSFLIFANVYTEGEKTPEFRERIFQNATSCEGSIKLTVPELVEDNGMHWRGVALWSPLQNDEHTIRAEGSIRQNSSADELFDRSLGSISTVHQAASSDSRILSSVSLSDDNYVKCSDEFHLQESVERGWLDTCITSNQFTREERITYYGRLNDWSEAVRETKNMSADFSLASSLLVSRMIENNVVEKVVEELQVSCSRVPIIVSSFNSVTELLSNIEIELLDFATSDNIDQELDKFLISIDGLLEELLIVSVGTATNESDPLGLGLKGVSEIARAIQGLRETLSNYSGCIENCAEEYEVVLEAVKEVSTLSNQTIKDLKGLVALSQFEMETLGNELAMFGQFNEPLNYSGVCDVDI